VDPFANVHSGVQKGGRKKTVVFAGAYWGHSLRARTYPQAARQARSAWRKRIPLSG